MEPVSLLDDDRYIRKMERMHKTGGYFDYKPNANDNVTINVGGLDNLFEATGWHLDMNQGVYWDVHCDNSSPLDYIVLRCEPFTSYYKVVNSTRVPANSQNVLIETFIPDRNEDQWWVIIVVNADGSKIICNGEPNGSAAWLKEDSKYAIFTWHQPYNFSIKVQLH